MGKIIHGLRFTREYAAWNNINDRCRNKNNKDFRHYGGRGIKNKYKDITDFIDDVGFRPSDKHSIDRINNDSHYQRGNCQWTLQRDQLRNYRRNIHITYNGKTQCLTDWANEVGINYDTLRYRIKAGWGYEKALTMTPWGH